MTNVQAPATLFQEAWWLDVASDGRAETVEVHWDGLLVGSLSFVPFRRYGMRRLAMPAYTRTLGPVLTLPPSGLPQLQRNVRRVVAELVARLPHHDLFEQRLDPRDESAFSFSLTGMTVTQAYTFVVSSGTTQAQVLARCSQKTRNIVVAASRHYHVAETTDLDAFIALSLIEHQGSSNTNDFALLGRIVSACLQRNSCHLLVARNDDSLAVAAAILLRGKDRMYFWLSARDRSRSSGANAALLMHGMELARRLGLDFDFDGYGTASAARFYASFGGTCFVRPVVRRASMRHEAITLLRRCIAVVHRRRGE